MSNIAQGKLQKVSIFLLCGCFFLTYSVYFLYIPIGTYIYVPLIFSFFIFIGDFRYFYFAVSSNKTAILFFILVLFLFFSLQYSISPNYGKIKSQSLLVWLFLAIFNFSSIIKHFSFFVKIQILFSFIFLLLLLSTYGNPLEYLNYVLLSGERLGQGLDDETALNPIWVSRYLALLIILLLYQRLSSSFFSLFIYLLIFIALIFCIASGSKGVLLSLLAAVAILKYNIIFKNKILFVFLAFLVSIFISAYFFGNDYINDRYSLLNSVSTIERLKFQENVISYTYSNGFIFGSGVGSTGQIINGRDSRNYPHNIFIEIFSDIGFVGLMMYVVIILHLFGFLFKIFGKGSAFSLLVSLFVFYFLNSNFSGDFSSNSDFFVFCVVLILFKGVYEKGIIYIGR